MTEGLDFRPNGDIIATIVDDDGNPLEIRIRRPKVRQYRQINDMLTDALRRAELIGDKVRALREQLAETDDPAGLRDEIAEANVPMSDLIAPITAHIIQTLGDRPDRIPDDVDDWPLWLIGAGIPTDMINHWRTVPKAFGGQSKN